MGNQVGPRFYNAQETFTFEQPIVRKLTLCMRVGDVLLSVVEVNAFWRRIWQFIRTTARHQRRNADRNICVPQFWKRNRVEAAREFIGHSRFALPNSRDRLKQIAIEVHPAPGEVEM